MDFGNVTDNTRTAAREGSGSVVKESSERMQVIRLQNAWRKRLRAGIRFAFFLCTLCIPGLATAIDFQVEFVESTYTAQPGDSFADLIAEHAAGTLIQSTLTDGLEDISATEFAAGANGDYGVLLTTLVTFTQAGTYTFQVGTDWGRGGGAAAIDPATGEVLSEMVLSEDLSWDEDWDHPDVFTTTLEVEAGETYTLAWVGFEGCCGGTTTIRFSADGVTFEVLTDEGLAPHAVPEPGTGLLLALGLCVLAAKREESP